MKRRALPILAAALMIISLPCVVQAERMGRSVAPKGIYGVSGGSGKIYGVRSRLNSRTLTGTGGSGRLFSNSRANSNAYYGVRRNYTNISGFMGKNFFGSGAKRFF